MHYRAKLSCLLVLGLIALAAGWAQVRPQPQKFEQSQPPAAASQDDTSMPGMNMPGMNMPGMNMPPADGRGMNSQQQAEAEAMHAMQPGHHMDGAHMRMTALRPPSPKDLQHADQLVAVLREVLERYKDYRVAQADGYQIFMPQMPQHEYHFNNYWNGFVESFTFDPARPTSLLYRKTRGGWELTGAMYTAPRTATLDQLNERVPLSVARWHEHLNLCMPKRGNTAGADWRRFGLNGSIATEEACTQAGGRFFPQIFGWMVHVYPFAAPDKIFMQ